MPHLIDSHLADGPCSDTVPGRCRVWTGFRDRDGYGCLADRTVKAHRLAWEQRHGAIPRGLLVLHRCDNPPCCNVAHLALGTAGDNAADRAGAANGHARLIDAKVQFIRRRYAAGGISQRELARMFGVSQTHVADIVARRRWPHLP